MNQEIKEKWQTALRSGEFSQTRGKLKDKSGYCCLGVLCEISGVGEWEEDEDGGFIYSSKTYRSGTYLPKEVRDLAGINSSSGDFTYEDGGIRSLASLNDNGVSFKEIADLVERYF